MLDTRADDTAFEGGDEAAQAGGDNATDEESCYNVFKDWDGHSWNIAEA